MRFLSVIPLLPSLDIAIKCYMRRYFRGGAMRNLRNICDILIIDTSAICSFWSHSIAWRVEDASWYNPIQKFAPVAWSSLTPDYSLILTSTHIDNMSLSKALIPRIVFGEGASERSTIQGQDSSDTYSSY